MFWSSNGFDFSSSFFLCLITMIDFIQWVSKCVCVGPFLCLCYDECVFVARIYIYIYMMCVCEGICACVYFMLPLYYYVQSVQYYGPLFCVRSVCMCMCMCIIHIPNMLRPLLFLLLPLLLLVLFLFLPHPSFPHTIHGALRIRRTWHPFYKLNAAMRWIQCENVMVDIIVFVCCLYWTRILSDDVIFLMWKIKARRSDILQNSEPNIFLFDINQLQFFLCSSIWVDAGAIYCPCM